MNNVTDLDKSCEFEHVIGAPGYCYRCQLRGHLVRWWPVLEGGWQVYECGNCGYGVKDR